MHLTLRYLSLYSPESHLQRQPAAGGDPITGYLTRSSLHDASRTYYKPRVLGHVIQEFHQDLAVQNL